MSVTVERTLPSLLKAIVDNRGRSCPVEPTGFPLIATNCIKDDHLYPVFENVRYVGRDTYDNWFRSHPKPGDVVFVCKGSPGRIAMVPDPVSFCIAQDMVALRADTEVIIPRYLYYALRNPVVQAKISNMHVGTMIPHFKKGDFGKLVLSIHSDKTDQSAIADVLVALDDKIVANAGLIARADELSNALFSGMLEGADLTPLTGVSRFVNGKAFTKNASSTGRVVIRIAELNSGIGASTVYNDIEVPDEYLARPGDLLFAWSGSLTLHRWFRSEGIINQHIFKVMPIDGYPLWVVNQLLLRKLDEFKAIAADKATTMGHIQRRHLEEAVGVPPRSEIDKYNDAMTSLWNAALNAEQESLRLGEIRDVLLPQLMSGKLRVKYAEKRVEAVV